MAATLSAGIDSLILKVTTPVDTDGITPRDDLAGIKVWYSTSPDFNPQLGQGILAYNGTGLNVNITGLTAKVLYYVKYALISEIDPDNYIVSGNLSATTLYSSTTVDTTPPPTPINVAVTAAISNIFISHDVPVYTQGRGHAKTLVYVLEELPNTLPASLVFDNAVKVAEFTGNNYTYATNPATKLHVWLKWQTQDGYVSLVASGGVGGTVVTTGEDVAKLLDVLTGEITESQLYGALGSRIDLIDDPETGLVKKTADLTTIYGNTVSAGVSAAAAVQAAADAMGASTESVQAAAAAIGAKAEVVQTKADVIIAQGLAAGSATTASTQAELATSAKDAAGILATNASQSATAAATSANTAAGSASTATTQANLATNAKNAASGFASEASQSAITAATSVADAAGSASTASTQANLATNAKDAASGFASNASQSATSAATSVISAAGSASTASTQAGLATNAKDAASDFASQASQSATAAATSVVDAAGSASTASTQADLATAAKNAASGFASQASQSATTAATSVVNAAGSASTATTQAGLATAAKNAASDFASEASQSAGSAATSVVNAAGSASTASTQANLATSAKNLASGFASQASQSAIAAANSVISAAGSASTASTQSDLATSAKNDALGFASQASQSAGAAATSAANAQGSASTASIQVDLATNAKNLASGFATNAGVSASSSAISETNALGYANSAATSLLNVQATIRGTSLGLPLEQWNLNGQTIVTLPGVESKVGIKALRLSSAGSYPNQGNYVPLDRTKKYRIKFWARPSSDANGLLYFTLRQFLDDAGNVESGGPANGGRSTYKPSGQSRTQHIATYGDNWGEYNFVWSTADWRDLTKFIQPDFLNNYEGTTGYWDIQAFTFYDITDIDNVSAAVQTEAIARASQTGGLFAQYSVKIDVAGNVAGYGLNSTSTSAENINWASVGTGIFEVVVGLDPGFTIFNEVVNGRKLGDVTNNGTVDSADATAVNRYRAGLSISVAEKDYIEGQLTATLMSNPLKYAAYFSVSTTTSEFGVRADRFYIAPPSVVSTTAPTTDLYKGKVWVDSSTITPITKYYTGTTWSTNPQALPFVVQSAPTQIGNVVVPAGVYIDTAFIRDATITTAKIADLAVDAAKIADATITAAKIADATISTAKIGDLQINTAKIGENAVTTAAYASYNGFRRWWEGNVSGTFEDEFATLTFSASTGDIVLLEATFDFRINTRSDYLWDQYTYIGSFRSILKFNTLEVADTKNTGVYDFAQTGTTSTIAMMEGWGTKKILRATAVVATSGTQTLSLIGAATSLGAISSGRGSYSLNGIVLSAFIRRR